MVDEKHKLTFVCFKIGFKKAPCVDKRRPELCFPKKVEKRVSMRKFIYVRLIVINIFMLETKTTFSEHVFAKK